IVTEPLAENKRLTEVVGAKRSPEDVLKTIIVRGQPALFARPGGAQSQRSPVHRDPYGWPYPIGKVNINALWDMELFNDLAFDPNLSPHSGIDRTNALANSGPVIPQSELNPVVREKDERVNFARLGNFYQSVQGWNFGGGGFNFGGGNFGGGGFGGGFNFGGGGGGGIGGFNSNGTPARGFNGLGAICGGFNCNGQFQNG